MGGIDWVEWHRAYERPDSSLAARLTVVRRRIGEALDELGPRCTRVVSLCAGDGRDLLPELAKRPDLDPEVLLVELDPALAHDARRRAADLGLGRVGVVQADAGLLASFADGLPADLLLLCGIFGNVVDEDIRTTLCAVPGMVGPGGFVLWTRGWFEDVDLRPAVRRWSQDAGLAEIAYDGAPAHYGVGLYRVAPGGDAGPLPARLFTFVR